MSSINKMFDKFNAINKYLFKKENLNLKEKYLYELTSYTISLIYEDRRISDISKTKIEISKAIIEIMALISYLDDNKDFENEVNSYTKYLERSIYLKYKDLIRGSFYHFDENNISDSNIDSLDIDMIKLITKYHSELIKYYEELSNDFDTDSITLTPVLITTVYIICLKLYPNIEAKYKETLEYADSFLINHPLSQRYMIYLRSECDLLKRVMNHRNRFIDISNMLISFSLDKIYLNSETFETKFVTIMNYLSEFYFDIINLNESNIDLFIDKIDIDEIDKNYIKLIYEESLNLNHRLGYSITSNIDVYQEYSIAIRFIELLIGELLKYIGDADIYNDFINIADSKNTFDFENQYLVDKKE